MTTALERELRDVGADLAAAFPSPARHQLRTGAPRLVVGQSSHLTRMVTT